MIASRFGKYIYSEPMGTLARTAISRILSAPVPFFPISASAAWRMRSTVALLRFWEGRLRGSIALVLLFASVIVVVKFRRSAAV